MDIGKNIKKRRGILKITQKDLAEMSGVALRTVRMVESSRGNPSLKVLNRIAVVLGMELKMVIRKPGE